MLSSKSLCVLLAITFWIVWEVDEKSLMKALNSEDMYNITEMQALWSGWPISDLKYLRDDHPVLLTLHHVQILRASDNCLTDVQIETTE